MKSGSPTPDGAPREGKPNAKRNERNSGASFWYLLIGGIVVIVGWTWMREQTLAKPLTVGDFVSGLESGKYNKSNVFNLTIGRQFISFQNQPKTDPTKLPGVNPVDLVPSLGGESGDAAKPAAERVQRYRIPIGGIADQKIADLSNTLDKKGIDYTGSSPETEWSTVLSIMLMASVVLIFILFLRKIGGPGQAMSFGRSRGRLYAEDDVRITFEDVAGIEEAVDELREVVEFLRTPGKYQALGGRIPRGVLLVGPPGTGKTLLAKAVAGEAGVPFFSLSGSDFVEMFVGVGAARVRDMFSQAGQKSPSIIFIDELDALGKVRGNGMPGGHDEREQTLNALLVEMDGFSSDQSVIVMGATNRPETLDPALMRPGRFDRHVLVDRPDYKGRAAILKVHSTKIKMSDDVDLGRIARLTPGFVGADLSNLVNEAALLAARNDKTSVSMVEFEEAIERVVAGLEKASKIIQEDEKQRVAYHECGHALVASSLPQTDPVHKISIIPRGFGALGYMLQRPEDDRHLITQTEIRNRICVMLGGIAAEDTVFEESSTGAQNDLERATDLARRMVMEFGMSAKLGRVNYRESKRSPFLNGSSNGPSDYIHSEHTLREIDLEVRRIIDECMEISREILRSRRPVLEQMTTELIEREVMNSDQLKVILDAHKTGPQLKPGTSAARAVHPTDDPASGSRSSLKQGTDE
ncbi:ATP-dependent zinc metalloprotease FtsH [Planctomicrobium piriforme]|uniref:ATP-dependent zinc metalloprotease FtsH n=1 Tax=Planctomicrobium piriforme TaxID=1576369 RepID=A0A1I3E279_9PLAN|nr:ATP-dependent zinc metalloprotease FtsH [Planctomicrobium piriforme]SFH93084.1 cell division protease FtsH [Planctomicrobium piriforme]